MNDLKELAKAYHLCMKAMEKLDHQYFTNRQLNYEENPALRACMKKKNTLFTEISHKAPEDCDREHIACLYGQVGQYLCDVDHADADSDAAATQRRQELEEAEDDGMRRARGDGRELGYSVIRVDEEREWGC